jgi:hypothetical protein
MLGTTLAKMKLNHDHIDSRLPGTIITKDTDRNAITTHHEQSTMIFGIMLYITRAFFS